MQEYRIEIECTDGSSIIGLVFPSSITDVILLTMSNDEEAMKKAYSEAALCNGEIISVLCLNPRREIYPMKINQ